MSATRTGWIGMTLLSLALSGCVEDKAKGGVRGRVLDANGQPARSVRVMLDSRDGRSTLTDYRGEFRLGASAGEHLVLARGGSAAASAGATAAVHVEGNTTVDAGDITLVPCDEVVIMDGPGTSDGSGDPNGSDGSEPPAPGDPTYPCEVEPPPPPPADVTIPSLEADFAEGYVDPWGLYGFADDADAMAGLDFFLAGDFTAGATVTVQVTAGAQGDAHVGLFTYDSYGYYYVLRSGTFTVTTAEDGDGDPSTLAFSVSGSDLVFDYLDWSGGTTGTYTATVGQASGAGTAWVWLPPAPPTEDVTIATFVADWKELYLCTDCSSTGDALFVYAWDGTNGADLSLFLPIAALTLPGETALVSSPDFSNEIYGGASYYGTDGTAAWFYQLDHATLAVGADAIAVGATIPVTLSDAQFDWMDIYGPTPVEGPAESDPNGGTSAGDFQLFIGSADLSGEVQDMWVCGNDVPEDEPTATPPAG